MNRKLLALIAVLPLVSLAGTKVTETPKGWLVLPLLTPNDKALKTHDECVTAATARGAGDFACTYTAGIKVELTCDDVPMPVLPTKVNADGSIEQPAIFGEVQDDGAGKVLVVTMEEGFVKGPDWALGKNCWVPGHVPYDGRFPAPDAPPLGANDMSPSPWAYTEDPEWKIGGPCPAQIDGKDDPKLCYVPPHPDVPPT